jgi:hypothetical protein
MRRKCAISFPSSSQCTLWHTTTRHRCLFVPGLCIGHVLCRRTPGLPTHQLIVTATPAAAITELPVAKPTRHLNPSAALHTAACTACAPYCGPGQIPLVNSAGVLRACQPASLPCPLDEYPITVWAGAGSRLKCMAMGSACPDPYTIKLYHAEGLWELEGLVAYNCVAPGMFATCDAVPLRAYGTTVSNAGGSFVGCVKSNQYGCPDDYQFAFLTITETPGIGITFTFDRCYPVGAILACQPPAIVPPATVLTYSTPAYRRGSLTSCIRAAAGPAAGVNPPVMYSCPDNYPLTAVSSTNPLQQPPSATSDIIISCHSDDSLCYSDVPMQPFQLLNLDIRMSYVSASKCLLSAHNSTLLLSA